MAVPRKVQRLLKATQNYNSFNRTVDLITVALFLAVVTATANKVMPKKIFEIEGFDPSWTMIGVSALIFVVLFFTQLTALNRRRELSKFEREAVLKAVRRNGGRR